MTVSLWWPRSDGAPLLAIGGGVQATRDFTPLLGPSSFNSIASFRGADARLYSNSAAEPPLDSLPLGAVRIPGNPNPTGALPHGSLNLWWGSIGDCCTDGGELIFVRDDRAVSTRVQDIDPPTRMYAVWIPPRSQYPELHGRERLNVNIHIPIHPRWPARGRNELILDYHSRYFPNSPAIVPSEARRYPDGLMIFFVAIRWLNSFPNADPAYRKYLYSLVRVHRASGRKAILVFPMGHLETCLPPPHYTRGDRSLGGNLDDLRLPGRLGAAVGGVLGVVSARLGRSAGTLMPGRVAISGVSAGGATASYFLNGLHTDEFLRDHLRELYLFEPVMRLSVASMDNFVNSRQISKIHTALRSPSGQPGPFALRLYYQDGTLPAQPRRDVNQILRDTLGCVDLTPRRDPASQVQYLERYPVPPSDLSSISGIDTSFIDLNYDWWIRSVLPPSASNEHFIDKRYMHSAYEGVFLYHALRRSYFR